MPTLPPDTSLTFEQVVLRVAEEAGLAFYDSSSPNSKAAIPRDGQVLDLIMRKVNDGIEEMARAYPKWTSLRPQVTLTLSPTGTGPLSLPNLQGDNDGSIYRLPWYVTGRPIDGWNFADPASNFAGFVRDVAPEIVDHYHRMAKTSAYPQFASIIPSPAKGDVGQDRQLRAVRIWPSPDRAYTLTARFRVTSPRMVSLQDRHIFGSSHDMTVVAFGLWALKQHDAKDPMMRETYRKRVYGDPTTNQPGALAESIRIDQEAVQDVTAYMTDPGIDRSPRGRYVNPGLDIVTSSMVPVLP